MAQNILERELTISNPGEKVCTFDYNRNNALGIVESIKKYIHENDCSEMSMDISHLNIIDASKVTILCSTYHWAKYPQGKISWLINSPEVNNLIRPLNLGNVKFITVQERY